MLNVRQEDGWDFVNDLSGKATLECSNEEHNSTCIPVSIDWKFGYNYIISGVGWFLLFVPFIWGVPLLIFKIMMSKRTKAVIINK